ncbi:MAG: hypothetical protein PHU06_03175 [Gallionella sp.]|nr:hypothetical protein [Gallionella sp.]MDD4958256.1 hypothetical protein [Gallionella sp.]
MFAKLSQWFKSFSATLFPKVQGSEQKNTTATINHVNAADNSNSQFKFLLKFNFPKSIFTA